MSKCIVLFIALATGSAILAGGDTPEALIKEYLKTTKEVANVLGTIKNAKSAEAAKKKLDQLGTRLQKFAKNRDALDKGIKALDKKNEQQFRAVQEALDKEFVRLEKLPAIWPVLEKTMFGPAILGRIEEARELVAQLTAAVQTYKAANDDFPTSLDALAKKRGKDDALVDDKALIDPWGRPYQYDVKGPRNQGKQPDIWSQGPAPADPACVLGNWNVPAKKSTRKQK
jgi:hypothetical protein